MASLTIRCRPCVPVPIGELESWLARRLEELRAELPELRVRLLRLTQPLPSDDIEGGGCSSSSCPVTSGRPWSRACMRR